jgi:group II intron reverse transcriptase/maturase
MLRARVVLPDGIVKPTDKGTPQGGPLSPLLSNVVLDELDQELARRGHRFVRYADDCNVYVKSERSGQRVMESLTDFIERRMKLKVNRDKSAVARPRDRKFLGFTLLRRVKSGKTRIMISNSALKAFHQKIRELTPRRWGASLLGCVKQINRYLMGWLGYFGMADQQKAALKRADAHIRRRLRAIQLKHWKNKRLIVRHLIRMGASARHARLDVYGWRPSWWVMSGSRSATVTLTNRYFASRGLYSLAANWVLIHDRIWD